MEKSVRQKVQMLQRKEWSEVSTIVISPCPGEGDESMLGDLLYLSLGRGREVTISVSITLRSCN